MAHLELAQLRLQRLVKQGVVASDSQISASMQQSFDTYHADIATALRRCRKGSTIVVPTEDASGYCDLNKSSIQQKGRIVCINARGPTFSTFGKRSCKSDPAALARVRAQGRNAAPVEALGHGGNRRSEDFKAARAALKQEAAASGTVVGRSTVQRCKVAQRARTGRGLIAGPRFQSIT